MFGFFKKKAPQTTQAKPPPIPNSHIEAVFRQFEEYAEGDIDPVEGALTMFQLDKERYVHLVIDALSRADVELLLCENNPRSAPLMLQSEIGIPMLPVFTQRRRTAKCQEQHPEYRFYLRLPFGMVLDLLRAGAGIIINPFEEVVTWTLPPELVDIVKGTIVRQVSEEPAPSSIPKYLAGQVWGFKETGSDPDAVLTVLYVEKTERLGSIVHVAVSGLNLPNGGDRINHMPFAEEAIDRSVTALIKGFGPVPDFSEGYKEWSEARGGVFTISVAEGVECVRKMCSDNSAKSPG
jgi:hypothetical protein